jgi:hypothetical protein
MSDNQNELKMPPIPKEEIEAMIEVAIAKGITSEAKERLKELAENLVKAELEPALLSYQKKNACAERQIPELLNEKIALQNKLNTEPPTFKIKRKLDTPTHIPWPLNELFLVIAMTVLTTGSAFSGVITLGSLILESFDWPQPIFAYLASFALFLVLPFGLKIIDEWLCNSKKLHKFQLHYRMFLAISGVIVGFSALILWAIMAPITASESYANILANSGSYKDSEFLNVLKTALSLIWEPLIGSLCLMTVIDKCRTFGKIKHEEILIDNENYVKLNKMLEECNKKIEQFSKDKDEYTFATSLYQNQLESFRNQVLRKFEEGYWSVKKKTEAPSLSLIGKKHRMVS